MTRLRPRFELQPLEPRQLLAAGPLLLDPIAMPSGIKQARIAVAGDFNGDGKLDLAVVTGANSQTRIRDDVVTVFNGQLRDYAGDGAGHFSNIGQAVPLDAQPRSMVAADFNHDGKTDIAMVMPPGEAEMENIIPGDKLGILIATGNGVFTALPHIVTSDLDATQIITGDFNGDSVPDLAVSGEQIISMDPQSGRVSEIQSLISVHFGAGNGLFTTPVLTHISGDFALSIAAADFNSDGKSDLAVGSKSAVQLLVGKGDGTFDFPAAFSASYVKSVATPDLNGDGRPDVLWFNSKAGTANFAPSTGKGKFGSVQSIANAGGGKISTLFAGDIDGDGKNDLILGPNVAGNGFYINQGLASFLAVSDNAAAVPVLVGDFTGDKRIDILSSDYSSLFVAAVPPAAAPPQVYLSAHGTLVIDGTRRGDVISVSVDGSRVVTILNGQTIGVRLSRVRAININGGMGNDLISIDSGVAISAFISAGGGDDTVQSGSGNDTINGEEGDDILNGGRGNDFVQGSAGDDTLGGGKGFDQIFGNSGADAFAVTDDDSELFDFNPNEDVLM